MDAVFPSLPAKVQRAVPFNVTASPNPSAYHDGERHVGDGCAKTATMGARKGLISVS